MLFPSSQQISALSERTLPRSIIPDIMGSANVSTIDTAKKATDDLKTSYNNFHANLEALKAAKKDQVKGRGFSSGTCGVITNVGGIIKDVLVLVNFIKSAIEGDPTDANEIITAMLATLSIIVQGVPSLLALALSICSPF
ncbi:unnamed protein product [Rhizoctonia solani]|uniref:Uncharacterized protein n=1 Tax=Rhizoctonia solani TaxID=456999 RepID=A0A8H3G9G8_9AGAM|nr:unnamed protein product [Rhizoctonia solani]